MGLFWPLDNPSHVARLVGLVSAVAGCCALADRETRYSILRLLYTTLKSMDETAAMEIEAAVAQGVSLRDEITDSQHLLKHEDHTIGANNARDTRSYASESTAFSRAASSPPSPVSSPTPSLQERQQSAGRAYLSHDDNVRTRPSSALDSTPDSVSQLGEALSRWKSTQKSALYTPSPLSRDSSLPQLGGADYNLSVQDNAVAAVARDEVLFPLTITASPQAAFATPESTNPQTPQTEPVPKAVDQSKRLSPLPNPKAPKIEPTMRDGRPQLFDYTPPQPTTPALAQPKSLPLTPPARRERGHVEIETTDHESYGFVSNPSALVPHSAGLATGVDSNGKAVSLDDGGDHYLFVCIKCNRQSTNEVCEKICSDEDGVLRCKLRPRDGQLVDDMEDLVMPMTPKIYVDGRRKTTGRMLYENLQALHTQHERMKARAACHGAGPHSHTDELLSPASRECPNAVKSRLRIVPVNCLSMCHLGNVIAVAGPGKFGYMFGAMHENESEDMQAILQFAEDYIESSEGFTKNKTRPARLSRNILARIPPPLPTFTSLAE
ncbi:hypothetical protein H4R27_003223 [Coemansia aciculifera]|uniref:Uncharacterized protein n=1 Tax=Coemansia pectinata TaxID=1052879 RepID=A0A9W8GYL3_9FUNG|nr:hypothetical protein GGI19_003974 [Coemansia pectinata]KAJ2882772.1 hypothetical protein H4R27_003223 [Coemansia aciculifera]